MSECECVDGKWGGICPSCGKTLPVPLPWEFGRPCGRTSAERGRGWDGRPLNQSEAQRSRWTSMQAASGWKTGENR